MKTILAVAFLSMLASHAEAQTPLQDIKLALSTSVENGAIRYRYKVSNPSSNQASVFSIDLNLDMDPSAQVAPQASGLQECGAVRASTSKANFDKYPVVPVGSKAPTGWRCGYGKSPYSEKGTYHWGRGQIKPGETSSGFELLSYGIPAIRDVVVEPLFIVEPSSLPAGDEEDSAKMKQMKSDLKWVGKTIGPAAPPKQFSASSFLSTLSSLQGQSSEVGWITDKGILRSLQVKLDNAKRKIEEGDVKASKNIINALMNELSAQRGKGVSEEAYSLLFFNAKYAYEHM